MSNNWILVDQNMLAGRHQEMRGAVKQGQMASLSPGKENLPRYAKALASLGNLLVQAGVWLQEKSGGRTEYRDLGIDDGLWGAKPKAPAC
ncbi:MAG: hypothetical protein R6V73_02570 [Anaerolineales bacterium]|jgi:hypothetical protein